MLQGEGNPEQNSYMIFLTDFSSLNPYFLVPKIERKGTKEKIVKNPELSKLSYPLLSILLISNKTNIHIA